MSQLNIQYPGFTYPAGHKHEQIKAERFQVADNIYVFHGYSTSVFSIIIGADGYVLIDTGASLYGAEQALAEIKQITSKPLKGIILTHSHPDHLGGAEAFLAVSEPDLPIWGTANFGAENAAFKGLEKISALRATRQFGRIIPTEQYTHNMMVPRMGHDAKPGKFVRPNHIMDAPLVELNIAGLTLELHVAPGETSDQLIVWVPASRTLFAGDNIYRSFPNLYPVRGAGFRDVAQWAASVRHLLDFKPTAVVMGHTEPAMGDEIVEMLDCYSRAIQYIFDETVKGMDAGLTPDELAVSIQLPEELRNKPYLAEYYGCVPWAIRSIFSGLLGWFDGNPTNLMPLPLKDEAERMAKLAGGREKLIENAQNALKDSDYSWAAQLADYALRLQDESVARLIKADALEALSKIILPISGKNYLLACALELRAKQ